MPPVPGSRVGERGCARRIYHLQQRRPEALARPPGAVAVILQGRLGLGQPSDLPKVTPWSVCRVSEELQYPHSVSPPEGRAQADRREWLLSLTQADLGPLFQGLCSPGPEPRFSSSLPPGGTPRGWFPAEGRAGAGPHRPTHAHSPHPALWPVSPPPPWKRPAPDSRLLGGS